MQLYRTNHVVNWFSCLAQIFFVICYPLLFKIELLPLHLSCLCFLRLACLGFTIGIASISEGLASGTVAGTWVAYVLINWDGLDQLDMFFVVTSFLIVADSLHALLSQTFNKSLHETIVTIYPPYLLQCATAVWGIVELFVYFAKYGAVVYPEYLISALSPVVCSIQSRFGSTEQSRLAWITTFSASQQIATADALSTLETGLGTHDAEWLISILLVLGLFVVTISNQRRISLGNPNNDTTSDNDDPLER